MTEELRNALTVLLAHLPAHAGELSIRHNEHKTFYRTAEDEESEAPADWVSPEERQRAIETNEVWTLTWYPDTPVSHYDRSASTLEALFSKPFE